MQGCFANDPALVYRQGIEGELISNNLELSQPGRGSQRRFAGVACRHRAIFFLFPAAHGGELRIDLQLASDFSMSPRSMAANIVCVACIDMGTRLSQETSVV